MAELIKEKKIIKKSNDILQILLNSYIEKEKLIYIEELLNSKKETIIYQINQFLLNHKTNYYLALSETILYFFEKNSSF